MYRLIKSFNQYYLFITLYKFMQIILYGSKLQFSKTSIIVHLFNCQGFLNNQMAEKYRNFMSHFSSSTCSSDRWQTILFYAIVLLYNIGLSYAVPFVSPFNLNNYLVNNYFIMFFIFTSWWVITASTYQP